jgi:quinone-modifying oxidoreductase subunit QmoC
MSPRLKVEPDIAFIRELRGSGGDSLKKCYQCATCSVVCELSGDGSVFPRKEMLWAQWGLRNRLMADASVWLCHQCNDCSTYCPRGARPGDVLAAVRTSVFRGFSFPAFMGKALASPAALPFLILVPVLVLLAIIFLNNDLGFGNEPPPVGTKGGYFKYFLPHGILEMLFIAGNVFIFAFAAVGLMRFWKGLKSAVPGGEGPAFIPSLVATGLEIMGHAKFRMCQANWTRSWAHLLVFFGFWAAFATAGLALIDMTFFGHHPPIPFFHPIKLLGNLSAVTLLVGSLALIVRRIADREKVGANGYADWLFLVNIFIVALTGVLTQVTRQAGPYEIAYAVYFIHITSVFFLLWYAPYSKFAHMFYRTLALVHARGLQPKEAEPAAKVPEVPAGAEQKTAVE